MYNLEKIGNNIINTYFKEVQMETSNLKNTVILKSIPSNIIEEAIIVLKKNIKIKEFELQNKRKTEKIYRKTINLICFAIIQG